MNGQEFLKLLKKWNGGILRGSQRKFAKELKIAESSVANFIKGRQIPSEKLIRDMAKLLSTSESNLQKIFDLSINNNIVGDKNNISINTENQNLKYELELAKKEILFLREQVDFYKSKK